MLKKLLLTAFALVLALGAGTYLALESGGVITVTTTNQSTQSARETHIWYVLREGEILLEAGNPNNPWVADLERSSEVQLSGDGLDGRYRLEIIQGEAGHAEIRGLMRDRYGWRDIWVAALFDTTQSRKVIAHPTTAAAR